MNLRLAKMRITTKIDKAENLFRYRPTDKNSEALEEARLELRAFNKAYQLGLKTRFKEGIKPKNKKGKFTKSRCVNDGERTYKKRKVKGDVKC